MTVLLFLFLLFVILDIFTTQWLILNDPNGIANEANPIGIMLYQTQGLAGLIFPKVVLFSVFAAMTMYFTTRLSHVKWFVEVSQTIVLILTAVSLVTVFNNFLGVLGVLYITGFWPLVILDRQTALSLMFVANLGLALVFTNGIMYMWGLRRKTAHVRAVVGLFLFLVPIVLLREGFREFIWLFPIYIISASTALGLWFYIINSKSQPRVVAVDKQG